jgi:hypothetical protein
MTRVGGLRTREGGAATMMDSPPPRGKPRGADALRGRDAAARAAASRREHDPIAVLAWRSPGVAPTMRAVSTARAADPTTRRRPLAGRARSVDEWTPPRRGLDGPGSPV